MPVVCKALRRAATMTGRRVRCRNCGTVFPLVPHEGPAPVPAGGAGDSQARPTPLRGWHHDDLEHEATIHASPPPAKPAATTACSPTGSGPVAAGSESPDAVFQEAFQDYKPTTRPNTIYKFPTAAGPRPVASHRAARGRAGLVDVGDALDRGEHAGMGRPAAAGAVPRAVRGAHLAAHRVGRQEGRDGTQVRSAADACASACSRRLRSPLR